MGSRVEAGVLGNALDGVDMESKTEFEEDSPVEDTDAMTIDEKSEIEAKVADALEANYETHDMVARAHSGARRCAGMPADSRSIAETHYQLGVAQAHLGDYASAEKSLRAAISVLNARISNLKKMEVSENITKELFDLETLIYEIKERTSDHKEMQRGTYKEDKDFVPMYNDVKEIVTRKSTITA